MITPEAIERSVDLATQEIAKALIRALDRLKEPPSVDHAAQRTRRSWPATLTRLAEKAPVHHAHLWVKANRQQIRQCRCGQSHSCAASVEVVCCMPRCGAGYCATHASASARAMASMVMSPNERKRKLVMLSLYGTTYGKKR